MHMFLLYLKTKYLLLFFGWSRLCERYLTQISVQTTCTCFENSSCFWWVWNMNWTIFLWRVEKGNGLLPRGGLTRSCAVNPGLVQWGDLLVSHVLTPSEWGSQSVRLRGEKVKVLNQHSYCFCSGLWFVLCPVYFLLRFSSLLFSSSSFPVLLLKGCLKDECSGKVWLELGGPQSPVQWAWKWWLWWWQRWWYWEYWE